MFRNPFHPYLMLHDRDEYAPKTVFYNRLHKLTEHLRHDQDLPVCTACHQTIPELEIYYTGADGRDYCQHCYDFDKHGISEE